MTEVQHLFQYNEKELANRNIIKQTVDVKPGFPCRLSLEDAEIGEEVYLFTYKHHKVPSPYQSSGPIFVRAVANEARLEENEIPVMLRHRLLSLRAYDSQSMMVDAKTVEGTDLEHAIEQIFTHENVRYIQVHNAGPGCYNCQIKRLVT